MWLVKKQMLEHRNVIQTGKLPTVDVYAYIRMCVCMYVWRGVYTLCVCVYVCVCGGLNTKMAYFVISIGQLVLMYVCVYACIV